jgi:UDP-N-acetylglucosamine 2-epimerase (non-hydrolysing)
MKVLTIFGTRPEAIKLAPVIHELQWRSAVCGLRSIVCVTAQHRQMLDQVLDLFGIVPDIDLNLMQDGQSPSQVAARVLAGLEPVLQAERPDWVLIQGDTTTVMATAIAAHHLRIRVGHVEAGLRSGDRFNPFPEEMNRVIADHLSDLHFAPTPRARQNLLREGIPNARIHVTGNTVVDALLWAANQPPTPEVVWLLEELGVTNQTCQTYQKSQRSQMPSDPSGTSGPSGPLILVTAHRRESFGAPLRRICTALRELVRRRQDVQVVYPVHLNPNVWGPVHELLGDVPRIRLLPPVDYLALVHLMKHSFLILTDSGGIQEEAPSLGVPVLVLREVTERPEAVEAGAARVVGTDPERIVAEAERLLEDPVAYTAMARVVNPFGDGHAAERIVAALMQEPGDEVAGLQSGRH